MTYSCSHPVVKTGWSSTQPYLQISVSAVHLQDKTYGRRYTAPIVRLCVIVSEAKYPSEARDSDCS